ncbi:MAG TPA: sulfite exporter TauE/SafE family protein, partial [Candidatus Limnocylindrales bacterium]
MVVTYAVKGEEGGSWQRKVVPNLVYQAAKLLSYVLVGLALGAIGSAFNLNGIRPWAMVLAGGFMIILGLGMTGRFPWAARLTPRPPKALISALSGLRRKAKSDAEEGESSLATPAAFGLLTGLMPCAPLQGAELAAAATGSALTGGIAMMAFGLGTFPLLFAFGTASSFIPKDWKHRLNLVLAVVVMLFGLVFLNRAALLTGFPVNSTSIKAAVLGGQQPSTPPAFTTSPDGVAEVPLKIVNVQYVPQSVSIPAGRPVRLVVDRQESYSCSDRLVIKQLGVDVPLAPNAVTKVDLLAVAAGTYAMTCGMGMMSGQIVAGNGGGGSGGLSPMLWLLVALLAAGGAL